MSTTGNAGTAHSGGNRFPLPAWLRRLVVALVAPFLLLFFCQCQSFENEDPNQLKKGWKRTVKSTRSSDYKIAGTNDNELPSAAKDNESVQRMSSSLNNEKVIRNSKGEVVRVEQRKDLYADATAKEGSREFNGVKNLASKESKYAAKEFKTPEYLRLQDYAGVKTFRESEAAAREGGQESRLASKVFETKTDRSSAEKAREEGSSFRQQDKAFKTSNDKIAERAQERAVVARGVSSSSNGYRPNVEMTMDDVKKLVNPGAVRN